MCFFFLGNGYGGYEGGFGRYYVFFCGNGVFYISWNFSFVLGYGIEMFLILELVGLGLDYFICFGGWYFFLRIFSLGVGVYRGRFGFSDY